MKPRIGVVLGDPSGIGPELIAKLLSDANPCEKADVLLIGDEWLLAQGQRVAGTAVDVLCVDAPEDADFSAGRPVLLRCETVTQDAVSVGQSSEAGGHSVLRALKLALDMATDGTIHAICFAPLNKHSMHLAGYGFGDELHWFAHELGYEGPFCELNVLDKLWTSRVTSHVALKDVAQMIDEDGIIEAVRLAHNTLVSAGYGVPRIAVAALNPHAGDGGIFGREEIDIIAPAVERAKLEQMRVDGPYPSDTVFLKAQAGEYDAIVTMYHDQGQIAMKLMGFDRGVTVQGGLPVPIATPAHGTAFDIAGQGIANVEAMRQAFTLAVRMGENRRARPAGDYSSQRA